MVQFTLPALALLALTPIIGAAPAPGANPEGGIFSFEKWVDGIVANPSGDHLSPEQAIAAYEASVNSTLGASLERREADCFLPQGQKRAYVSLVFRKVPTPPVLADPEQCTASFHVHLRLS